jgi:ABC-type branched-subunit amino acid transport system substrate-binding protein
LASLTFGVVGVFRGLSSSKEKKKIGVHLCHLWFVFFFVGVRLLASDGGLTPPEQRGKQVYRQGTSPSGRTITALLGKDGNQVPAAVLACANCHGYDGRGRPEGGVTPSNITWEALTKPYGDTHPGSKQHPPYTERLLKRAITMGIDPAGNPLHVAMPRYRMSQQDMADLIAYVKRLGKILDPGLTETSIRVGVILPPRAELQPAVKAALTAYFDEINQAGGVYTRRIELRFAEASGSAVRALLEDGPVFALTSSFMTGADEEIARLVQEKEVPVVGAFSLFPQTGFPLNRYVFYLCAGLGEQGRALAAFAATRSTTKNPPTAILYPDQTPLQPVAEAIKTQCRESGWTTIEEIAIPRQAFNTAPLVHRLSETATEVVFFLGPSGAESAFLQEAHKRGWMPMMLIPGSLAGRDLFDAPSSFENRIFLSYPILPSDVAADAAREYQKLAQAHHLASPHQATQWIALSSAKLLVEGLKRAGRDLNRERLIEALEGLYKFATGFTPAVTYGPNRRLGARGAHIVPLDLRTKGPAAASQWIDPN